LNDPNTKTIELFSMTKSVGLVLWE